MSQIAKILLAWFFAGIALEIFIYATGNKYSKEMNENFTEKKNPLRMAKLNLIWDKARKRLSEPKLRKLFFELEVQDKEELTLKRLKSSGGDKDGLKEAELRKRLLQTTKKFSLEGNQSPDFSNEDEKKAEKAIFKDKKLLKVWFKAEKSGLTDVELRTLKEEFQHHQDKIEQYYELVEKASNEASPNDVHAFTNQIHDFEAIEELEGSSKDFHENINDIRDKHRELKNSYNDLHRKATSGPESKEFTEHQASSLWKLALRGNFDNLELESLHTELKHFEARILKLNYLSTELNKTTMSKVDHKEELSEEDREKILSATDTEGMRILEERLQKQKKKVQKFHEDLEVRILARHSEL